MKIAVEGCAHGELDKIYEALQHLESVNKIKVDLLIVCGDFQSVRNQKDMYCMAVPDKYKQLNTFYKYHSGEKVAPVLTIFIGGNHEASNYLCELFYGGWVCPNIYYMGRAGVVQVNGIRIAGLSGIYKGQDYLKGHYEHVPFTEETKRSVYHVRNLEVYRLKQLKQPLDIFISHDWPKGIYNYGNVNRLLKRKAFFREEVEKGTLGSRPAEELLNVLQPSYWFAAHLHCKFAALVPHNDTNDSGGQAKTTRFLALDKCLPRRQFLQILDVGPPLAQGDTVPVLEHDPEWLAILSLTNHLMGLTRQPHYMPGPGSSERYEFTPTEEEQKEISGRLDSLKISPEFFKKTAGSHDMQGEGPFPPVNPQTHRLCNALSLTDPAATLTTAGFVSPVQTPTRNKEVSDNPSSSEEDEDNVGHDDDTDSESGNTPRKEELSGVKGLFIIDKRRSGEFAQSDKRRSGEFAQSNKPKEAVRSKLILSAPVNCPEFSSEQDGSDDVPSSPATNSETIRSMPVEGFCTPNKPLFEQDQFKVTDELESDLDKGVKRLSDADDSPASVATVKRTMKRRNLNLYRANDEENEDM